MMGPLVQESDQVLLAKVKRTPIKMLIPTEQGKGKLQGADVDSVLSRFFLSI